MLNVNVKKIKKLKSKLKAKPTKLKPIIKE